MATRRAGRSRRAPRTKRIPSPLTTRVLAAGKKVFSSKCQRCHGPKAQGDGPDADKAHKADMNLTVPERAANNPDGVVFYKVWNGRTVTQDAAFCEELTKEQVWAVVAYVQSLRAEVARPSRVRPRRRNSASASSSTSSSPPSPRWSSTASSRRRAACVVAGRAIGHDARALRRLRRRVGHDAFRDDLLGPLGGVFHGTVVDVSPGQQFPRRRCLVDPAGRRSDRPDGAAGHGRSRSGGCKLHVRQDGYEPSPRWRRYYAVVSRGWQISLTALKRYAETK